MSDRKQPTQIEAHELLLSAATVPLLAGLIAARVASEMVMNLSQASEEIFRGDRLPILHFTQSPDSES
ncbi:hypothetical protein [Vacuolonema iberomarrocanum]|uniref:hypothetical protein n=1 Tax=Vacuolonema iberomarrocanum TaxID=3454632 RepID=UPI003F6DB26A